MKTWIKRFGYLLLSAICILGALLAFQFGFSKLADVRKLDRLPTSPTAAVTNGVYALAGKIDDRGTRIVAPYSGDNVVYYRYELREEYRDSDGNTQTRTLERGESAVPFALVDNSGSMLVEPGSQISAIEFSVGQTYFRRNGALIYTENTLKHGQLIEVLGKATLAQPNALTLTNLPSGLKGIVTDKNIKAEGGDMLFAASLLISLAAGLLAVGLAALLIFFKVHRYWVFVTFMIAGLMTMLGSLGFYHLQKDWRDFAELYQQREQGLAAMPSNIATQDLYSMFVLVKRSADQWPDSLLFEAVEQTVFRPPALSLPERQQIETQLQVAGSSQFSQRWVAYVIAAVGIVFCFGFIWLAFKAIRFKRLVEFIPTSSSAGLSYGFCELKGSIELDEHHKSLTSHLNGFECVAYQYKIEERRGSGKNRRWVTIESNEQSTAFLLKDDQGSVTVNPAGANIVFPEQKVKRSGNLKYTEDWLPPKRTVYCLGFAGIGNENSAALQLQNDDSIQYLITTQDENEVVNAGGAKGFLLTGLAVGLCLMAFTVLLAAEGLLRPLDLLQASLAAPLVLLILVTVLHYNGLVFLKNRVDKTKADIDTLLQRRHDLWPQLMNAVGAHLKHEQELLTAITELRNGAPSFSKNPTAAEQTVQKEQTVTRKFTARIEAYPELKANGLVKNFMEKMERSENELALIRKGYNDSVELYNTQIQKLPDVILAKLFGFKDSVFFQKD